MLCEVSNVWISLPLSQEKFKIVFLDDDNLEEKFDEAYSTGVRKSDEPLFTAYAALRKKAEQTEEEALNSLLFSEIPRSIKKCENKTRRPPG